MASLAAVCSPFAAFPRLRGFWESKQQVTPRTAPLVHDSALFTHALVALSAKLAAADGPVTKAEYQAFEALFGGPDTAEAHRRGRLFLKLLQDRTPALQYARQLASMTAGDTVLHRELLQRLLRIASADATLNAVEMEWLRAVAAIFQVEGEAFRTLLSGHVTPATSPYAVLGVSHTVTDSVLRARYMAQVQKLHPDRFAAAGASADTVSMLSEQLAALNAAYQQVRAERAKKHSPIFGRKYAKGAKAVAA